MELKSNILALQWEALTIKRKINKQIRMLPDNTAIQRINKQANCFIIQFSTIQKDKFNNLSPTYYDFKYQYRGIVDKIKNTDPLQIYDLLQTIVKDKSFRVYRGVNVHGQNCYETIQLHPEVIKYINEII